MAGAFAQRTFDIKVAVALRPERRMYSELLRDQALSPAELHTLQSRRAMEMVRWAASSAPFYRERYRGAGLTAGDLDDPAVFASLPILEKDDVRARSADLHTPEATPRTSRFASTGGSTGEPLKLLHDTRVPARTLSWRLFGWWGLSPADNIAHVYRSLRTPRQRLKHNLQWWPSRSIEIDAERMDERAVAAFLAGWRRTRPALLLGYVGGIYELALRLEADGIDLPPVKAVGVTAAPITAAQRALMTRVFRAPVYDHYRCGEVPWIAGECTRQQGLHTFGDARLIEVVDGQGRPVAAGQTGDVVVTDLRNRVFPLVRYRLGDRAALLEHTCPCGVGLPLMSSITGRVSEALHLPDGRVVAGEGLTAIFDDWPDAVRQYQVHQHADGSVTLRCVRGPDPDADAAINRVAALLTDKVRGQVPVRIELVARIEHERGKTRFIVSDLVPVDPTPAA